MLISSVRSKSIGAGALLLSMWAISGIGSFAEAPAPTSALEPPAAEEMPSALSPAAEKARATVEGYPAEREAILAELEEQSLEETISQALHVWPSDAFTTGYSRGPFVNDRQKYLLQDPRLARVLHAAINGTEEERAAIQAQVIQIIESVLAERRKREKGLPYDEVLLEIGPGMEVFPIVLAEIDRSGDSLPVLLAWHDADQGPERSQTEVRNLYEKMGIPIPPPGTIVLPTATGAMQIIACAARRISSRTNMAWAETTPEHPEGFTSYSFATLGMGGRFVDDLSGYDLPEELTGLECYEFMSHLRLSIGLR